MVCWLTLTVAAGVPAVGVVMGAVAVGTIASQMTTIALNAYEKRQQQEKAEKDKRRQLANQRINQLNENRIKNSFKKPLKINLPFVEESKSKTQEIATKDNQKRLQAVKSRLPQIQSEYQSLIEQNILDKQTVKQALQKVSDSLNQSDIQKAEQYLQLLDDARIIAINTLDQQWSLEIQYLQERLSNLSNRFPQSVTQQLQQNVQWLKANKQQISENVLQDLHETINDFEDQAWRIQRMASDLVDSWSEVGYTAEISEIDNGTIAIQADTHEEGNTTMLIEFQNGQIYASTPHGDESPFTPLLQEVIQQFQEKGYSLDWTSLEGQSIPEKWRTEVSHSHSHPHSHGEQSRTQPQNFPSQPKKDNRQKQGY